MAHMPWKVHTKGAIRPNSGNILWEMYPPFRLCRLMMSADLMKTWRGNFLDHGE